MRNFITQPLGGLLFAALICMFFSACEPKEESIVGRKYGIQCNWTHLTSIDFSPQVTFNEGGTLTQVDDTATWTGTWTETDGTVDWSINNAPKNTRFRGSFDRLHLDGNASDDQGLYATFVGNRL